MCTSVRCSDASNEGRGTDPGMATSTPTPACAVCLVRPAQFLREQVCSRCRLAVGRRVLEASLSTLSSVWFITSAFDERRRKVLDFERARETPAEAAIVASVAQGLLDQGLADDALVLAAVAIGLGEGADSNRVGASALEVLVDRRLAKVAFPESLRAIIDG